MVTDCPLDEDVLINHANSLDTILHQDVTILHTNTRNIVLQRGLFIECRFKNLSMNYFYESIEK